MEFFLDTAIVDEIRTVKDLGMLDGVTTNPTHLATAGRPFKEVAKEIVSIVDGPVSLEVVSETAEGMLREAHDLVELGENVVVKVPATRQGIKAMKQLAAEGIPVNSTLIFSPIQALLVAKAGACYVSPFVGRLDAIGHIGMELVQQIRTIYDNYDYPTKILVAAVRHPEHILEAALAGADVATMSYAVFNQLYDHPLTDSGLAQFLADWKKVPQ